MVVKTLSALKLTGRVIKSSEGRKKSDQLFAVEIGGKLRHIGLVQCEMLHQCVKDTVGGVADVCFFPFR